jgi:3-hydroxyacyl-CoA dehydrogenase
VGRSLLHAVNYADWIIDTLPEEAATHARFLEQVEQVARRAMVLTSCVATLHASELAARLRRPERLLALHVSPPVELMPLVEVIPGPLTDPVCTEDVRYWLLALGRVPVTLEREVPGHAVERIAAAVWRECAQLLRDGVIGAHDLDRAISLGLALGWMATGPVQALAASGDEAAIAARLHQVQALWPHLSTAHGLDTEELHRLGRAIERAFPAGAAGPAGERLARLLDARGGEPA